MRLTDYEVALIALLLVTISVVSGSYVIGVASLIAAIVAVVLWVLNRRARP